MERGKSIFSIKLVRNLFLIILVKVIGFTILFFLYFSPSHRTKPNPEIIYEDVFGGK